MTAANLKHSNLLLHLKLWACELGFAEVGVALPNIPAALQNNFRAWLKQNYHGDMEYLARPRNLALRFQPKLMLSNVKSVLMFRMNYWSEQTEQCQTANPKYANIARYALGRDYHKIVRGRLKKLAQKITQQLGADNFSYRIFCDSAPILEKFFAAQAGLGFIGKNGVLINPRDGSYFVLGGIYTNLDLAPTQSLKVRCGTCRRCLDACPTKALIAPQVLNATRCLSYVTIEQQGKIADEFKRILNNQIFGCDICQQVCPWNRLAKTNPVSDFLPKPHWHNATISELKTWDEKTFKEKTQGTPLSRLSFKKWQRNLSHLNYHTENKEKYQHQE